MHAFACAVCVCVHISVVDLNCQLCVCIYLHVLCVCVHVCHSADISSCVAHSEDNQIQLHHQENINSGVPPSDDNQPAALSKVINPGMALPDDYID